MDHADLKFRLLSEPHRRLVLAYLARGEADVSSIGDGTQIERTLLSHHLRLLFEAGLLKKKRDGRRIVYGLAPGVLVSKNPLRFNFGCCEVNYPGGP